MTYIGNISYSHAIFLCPKSKAILKIFFHYKRKRNKEIPEPNNHPKLVQLLNLCPKLHWTEIISHHYELLLLNERDLRHEMVKLCVSTIQQSQFTYTQCLIGVGHRHFRRKITEAYSWESKSLLFFSKYFRAVSLLLKKDATKKIN